MNILVFSWRDPKHPLAGGAEQVMHEHMKGWLSVGHEVTLFSSSMPGLPKSEVLDRVKIIRGGYQYLGVQISAFLYYLKNRNKFDFLVDEFHGVPFFTPLYSSKPKIAVIQELAHAVWFKNHLPFPLNLIIGAIGFVFEPFVFLFYRNVGFMTGSASAKEDLKRFGIKDKAINIVPHGVLIPKRKINVKKEEVKTVAYLGVLSKDKGIEDAIEVFKFLNKSDKYNFWVIGKPETEEYFIRIKRRVAEYGLTKKIKFFGYVSKQEKFELLSKSHVLINPSFHEGWGLVNIEAASVGTPTVAYPSAGLVDSVKDGVSGVVADDKSTLSLVAGVEKLLGDKVLYQKLVDGAYRWSRKFSWDISKKMSLDLIQKIYEQN